MSRHPLAGQPAQPSMLVDVTRLVTAYYAEKPDVSVKKQRVSFGTSGHRGSSLRRTFNENHILAISQAIADYRLGKGIDGPLYLGIDTHALSVPAMITALEVLAAKENNVQVRIAGPEQPYTPTPAVSRAIIEFNQKGHGADGIVITPSHNPAEDGGFKYNSTNGGPADEDATQAIQDRANELLEGGLRGVKRAAHEKALRSGAIQSHDFLGQYVAGLAGVINFEALRGSRLRLGVDPLGGAGVHYWPHIAERYGLALTVVSDEVDPRFGFMTLDHDGQIRTDPSSRDAMQRLIVLKDRFDVAMACDADHDRHGIVTPVAGLMPPNHYLAVAISYLFKNRPDWPKNAKVGKTLVSSTMIDRVAEKNIHRELYEVPVGFKWFVDGLFGRWLGFGGEESAGASLLRKDGATWTTDKDGIALALLAAEIMAVTHRDPGEIYGDLTEELGYFAYDRIDEAANADERETLKKLTPEKVGLEELAGDEVLKTQVATPDNGAKIGGVKVETESGWFAVRPSGTEDKYKLYAESFCSDDHLRRIQDEAKAVVARILGRR